jgi:hypothetical protein
MLKDMDIMAKIGGKKRILGRKIPVFYKYIIEKILTI